MNSSQRTDNSLCLIKFSFPLSLVGGARREVKALSTFIKVGFEKYRPIVIDGDLRDLRTSGVNVQG